MDRIAPDRPVTVELTVDAAMLEEARALGVDLARAFADGLRGHLRTARRAAELAPTVDAWNAHWAEHGAVADEYRDEDR